MADIPIRGLKGEFGVLVRRTARKAVNRGYVGAHAAAEAATRRDRAARRADGARIADPGKVLWAMLGLAVASVAQWAVITLLARFGTPHMVGQYAFGLAVSAPVMLVAGLGLRTVLVTETQGRFDFDDYLRLGVVAALVGLVPLTLIAGVRGSADGVIIMLVGLAKAIDGIGEIYFGFFQRRLLIRTISVAMMVNSVLTLLLMGGLLLLTGNAAWATLGSVIGSTIGSIAYSRRAARRLTGPSVPGTGGKAWRHSRLLLVIAFPVGLSVGLNSFTTNIPRYILERQQGTAALGIFAALSYVVLAANTFFSAVSQTVLPRMAQLHQGGHHRRLAALTGRLVLACLVLGACACLVAAVVGGPALRLLYGAEYAGYTGVLVVLTVAVAFSGTLFFINTALLAARRFGNQLTASVAMLGLNMAVSVLLVPAYGLVGAAWTVVVALGVETLIKVVMLIRSLSIRPGERAPGAGRRSGLNPGGTRHVGPQHRRGRIRA
ncbi:lipopolysaccharide biosynthesis protein [Micromonospora sp. AKA38]|uniref:lipopolysaccharide biosynthesis protein n=1 Tax=Micromonospora sp. AKA38 TaxID=2733861 RepID=UPI0024915743|nr:oligosaccharide flippase family protein [Micromonospora sp. AKA38]